MPMTVEAALVTRKAAAGDFNTDSINASGKTWPREIVHGEKGIKAVGTGKDVPYYVLASSPVKGTAESAVDLFKSCTQIFSPDMANAADVIGDFYTSFSKVLNEAGYASSDCELEIFCGYGDRVVLAKNENSKLYRINAQGITEVLPPMTAFADGKALYGVCEIENVCADEIFILINAAVAAVLPENLIKAIANSANGDIKKIASILSSQADKYDCKGAVSAIAVKITEIEALPVQEAAAAAAPAENEGIRSEAPVHIDDEEEEELSAEEATGDVTEEEKPKGKIVFGIVVGIFIVLLAVLGFLAGRGIAGRHQFDETTTAAESTTIPESTTEESTAEESTAEESTTEETTSEQQTEETTSARTETTTRETHTTDAPETTAPATTADAGTSEEPAENTTDTEEPSEEAPTEANGDPSDEEPATAPVNGGGTGEQEESTTDIFQI